MNFLQLCQAVRRECGISGEGLPTTVAGQTGALAKIVARTAQAWVDIQKSHPYWKFLHTQQSFATVASQREYAVIAAPIANTHVDKFDQNSIFIYLTDTSDETRLLWRDYQWFRRNVRTYPDGRPTVITEQPGRVLAFDRTPDDVFTVTFDYWKTPELLAADDDIPAIPEHFHDLIVWKSVMMYAGAAVDAELFQYARSQYIGPYNQLKVDQGDLPSAVGHFPLAGRN